MITKKPQFPGTGEIDQLGKIFKLLGAPNERSWPGFKSLPGARTINFGTYGFNNLAQNFSYLSPHGLDLLASLLSCNPNTRISAQEALSHPFFNEMPLAKDPEMFPSFPSKAGGEKVVNLRSPTAPRGPLQEQ